MHIVLVLFVRVDGRIAEISGCTLWEKAVPSTFIFSVPVSSCDGQEASVMTGLQRDLCPVVPPATHWSHLQLALDFLFLFFSFMPVLSREICRPCCVTLLQHTRNIPTRRTPEVSFLKTWGTILRRQPIMGGHFSLSSFDTCILRKCLSLFCTGGHGICKYLKRIVVSPF